MDYKDKIKEILKDKTIPEEQREKLEEILLTAEISKDERIRKELINYFTEGREFLSLCSFGRDEILAWLENQDKHHIACSEEQMKVLDKVLNFAANHESPYWNNYIFETLNNFIRQLKN